MGVNDGLSETFIFHVKTDIFKVVLNFTNKMCTVYTTRGHIVMRMEKLSQIKMNKIRKQLNDYLIEGNKLRGSSLKFFWGFTRL
jgi:hypothetical protein